MLGHSEGTSALESRAIAKGRCSGGQDDFSQTQAETENRCLKFASQVKSVGSWRGCQLKSADS